MVLLHGLEGEIRCAFSYRSHQSLSCSLRSSGDVIYISVGGQGILILNSFKVAADLLDRRAGIYSSRMRTIGALASLLVLHKLMYLRQSLERSLLVVTLFLSSLMVICACCSFYSF